MSVEREPTFVEREPTWLSKAFCAVAVCLFAARL